MPAAAVDRATPRRGRLVSGALSWGSAAALVAFGAALYVRFDTPALDVAAFAAYWTLAVILPGTLVHKALRGTQGTWLADLSLGAVTGLCLELLAWMLASLAHAQSWLWLWPLLTLPLLLLPRARDRLRERPDARGATIWAVATAAAVALGLNHVGRTYLGAYDLIPGGRPYYVDLPWHMSLVAEAQRSFPLLTPQMAAAGPVKYSWFVHAHLASASLVTGVDFSLVVLRLWPLPLVALAILLPAVVARRVTGSSGAGAVAAWLTLAPVTYHFWPEFTGAGDIFMPVSPTRLYSMPISTMLVGVLLEIVRRGRDSGRGTFAVALLVALATTGSKSSITAMVFCGVGAAFLVSLILRRRRALLGGLLAACGVLTVLALLLVTGGNYGTGLQLFSALTLLPPYRGVAGMNDFTLPVPAGFTGPGGTMLLAALLLAVGVRFARQLSFLLPFVDRRLRGDLGAWLLAGTVFSAWVPFLVMGHRGYSEYYFMFSAVPFSAVLIAWWAHHVVGGRREDVFGALAAGVPVAVASAALYVVQRADVAPRTAEMWRFALRAFTVQVLVGVGGLVLLVALVAFLVRRGRRSLAALPVALLLAPPIGIAVVWDFVPAPPTLPDRSAPARLPQGEAALWLREHVPADALVATNAQCLGRQAITCDAKRWWVSGLAGRRVLLEGWAYTPYDDGTAFTDAALYDFNQSLFADPAVESLAQARRLGVTWLVAERLPGLTPSPKLDQLASKRYDNGTVAVYELQSR